jgi:DNA recombination protein RmuC
MSVIDTTQAIHAIAMGGFIIGGVSLWRLQRKLQQTQIVAAQSELYQAQVQNLTQQLTTTQTQKEQLIRAHESMKAQFNQQQQASEQQQQQFQLLAQEVIKEQTQQLQKQNKEQLHLSLDPLRQQIQHFQQNLNAQQQTHTTTSTQLTAELHKLQELNLQMSEDAIQLTQALRGNNKQQGNWGEMVLTNILQASGLREGHEFVTQASYRTDEGGYLQPDVVVHLPEQRDIIIDAKMSLVDYEKYFHQENSEEKQLSLNLHLQSVKKHIKSLAKKDYHLLHGVPSLDYVLMFIPIEPAFLLAIEKEPKLVQWALENKIMLVSPNTLMMALKTIHYLWQRHNQQENAEKIASAAGKMYDKLVGYTEDFTQVGHELAQATHAYQNALKKLTEGRGNLIKQADDLRQLGAATNKKFDHSRLQSK